MERPFSKGQAWVDLLGLAEYIEVKNTFRGVGYVTTRGQFRTTKRCLADRWGWYKAKVIRFLDMLVDKGMIIYESDDNCTLIKILNYDRYQSDIEEVAQPKVVIPEIPRVEVPEIRLPMTPELKGKVAEINNILCAYFGITELRNINQFIKAGTFCMTLDTLGRLTEFVEQFQFFKKYKETTGEKIPSLDSFLGSPYEGFNDGKWCSENWKSKLSNYANTQPKKRNSRYYVADQDHSASSL